MAARQGGASGAVRVGWIDAARGIGIVLVVIGHALGGLIDSPFGRDAAGFRPAFLLIYSFHMPLFLVLAGLLVPARVARGGAGAFLGGLLPALAWPYFLWSALQFSLIFALGSLVNRPADAFWPTLLALPWHPVSQFWFLYALFWMHVTAAIILPRGGAAALIGLGIAAKLAAALLPMPVGLRLVANHMVWYALGVGLAGMAPGRMVQVLLGGAAAGMAAVLAAGQGGHWFSVADGANSAALAGHAWALAAIPAALAGIAGVLALAALPYVSASGLLAYVGRRTMAIFVLHIMCIAGTRIVLTRLDLVTDPWALLFLAICAGLAGPLLAEQLLRPLRLQRWLGF